jgi:hypothetical protein
MGSFPRREVAACAVLGAVYLGVFWWRNGAFLDSDEAVVGLMARHILRGEFPVFYWGQEYLGAVEAYLAAPFFALFGNSVQALKLVPVLFSIATIPIAADVLFIAAGRRAAIAGAFVFAFPPLAFSLWSIKARGGFTETAELGFWLLWMALRMARSQHRQRWAAAFGLTLGVGLWWSYFVVPYAIVAVMVLLHQRFDLRSYAIVVALTVVGAAPALWHNAFTSHWATVVHAIHPDASQTNQPDHAVPAEALDHVEHIGLPAMMGLHDARVAPFDWSASGVGFGLAILMLFGLARLLSLSLDFRSLAASQAALGPLLGAVLMVGLYVNSRFGYEPEPRYLLALWLGVGCCYAAALDTLLEINRWVGAGVALLLVGFQTWHTHFSEKPVDVAQWRVGAPAVVSYAGLIEVLKSRGVTHLHADYWTAERITFESRETIIAADMRSSRNIEAKQIVSSDPRSCWLSTVGNEADVMVARGWSGVLLGVEVPGLNQEQVLACPRDP